MSSTPPDNILDLDTWASPCASNGSKKVISKAVYDEGNRRLDRYLDSVRHLSSQHLPIYEMQDMFCKQVLLEWGASQDDTSSLCAEANPKNNEESKSSSELFGSLSSWGSKIQHPHKFMFFLMLKNNSRLLPDYFSILLSAGFYEKSIQTVRFATEIFGEDGLTAILSRPGDHPVTECRKLVKYCRNIEFEADTLRGLMPLARRVQTAGKVLRGAKKISGTDCLGADASRILQMAVVLALIDTVREAKGVIEFTNKTEAKRVAVLQTHVDLFQLQSPHSSLRESRSSFLGREIRSIYFYFDGCEEKGQHSKVFDLLNKGRAFTTA